MGLDRFNKTPCGFCFVEYYTHQDALDCLKYVGGTKLDERIIRTDLDPGFEEGRQYGYVEWHSPKTRYCGFLTPGTDVANRVARFAMNIAKNTIRVVGATVEHTLMTRSDGRKKNMERVSDGNLRFAILAQKWRLYKDQFYYQKAEIKIQVYQIPPSESMRILYKWTGFTS